MTQTSTPATARRLFHVHRQVHIAVAGAENSLCGVRLIAAVDTEFPASCPNCLGHRFETTPGLWSLVQPIGDGTLPDVGGLPESTAGF